ncbi:hypothetical protein SDD30_11800 [Moorella naiadis]|uniref:hypothetical protein n=1 Tax=Moorella naiadis (nom. illeg.) TaxID=3093670 RepID=UPI003D9CBB11
MAVAIINGVIQVVQFRTNAAMSQGKCVSDAWTLNTKSNITLGQVNGLFNFLPTGANILYDPDFIDSNIIDGGLKSALGPSIVEVV